MQNHELRQQPVRFLRRCHRRPRWLADAQNAQIWTTSALIGTEPTSAHNGGSARGYLERFAR
jgi:hypothetical protein